jgi:hypothetical protein
MFLNHEDEKKYPKCKELMFKLEASLRHQPDVSKAFFTVCNAAQQPTPPKDVEKIARQALRYGPLPRIRLYERPGFIRALGWEGGKGTIGEACAWNDHITAALHHTPVEIEIISPWFDSFEFGYYPGDPTRPGQRLTITLLHELVHWVRKQTKASDDAEVPSYLPGEAGELFERIAYGGLYPCNHDELFDALTSFRRRPF